MSVLQSKGGHKAALWFAGALFTLWIIPLLTRQVQDRATARDLKAELAEEMASSFAQFDSIALLRAYELVQRQIFDQLSFAPDGSLKRSGLPAVLAKAEFDRGYRNWQRDTNVIGTQLNVYFSSDTQLLDSWTYFASAATLFYFLTENTRDEDNIAEVLPALVTAIDSLNGSWSESPSDRLLVLPKEYRMALKTGQVSEESIFPFFSAYNETSGNFMSAADGIIKRMLRSHTEGFLTRRCDLVSAAMSLKPGRLCYKGQLPGLPG